MKRIAFMAALLCVCAPAAFGQRISKRAIPAAVVRIFVVDERLSAVRSAPGLAAPLLFRARRGRMFTVSDWQSSDGVIFLKVKVSSKRSGWIQWDAAVIQGREGEDLRLMRLILNSEGFERLDRTHIFLEVFKRSRLRPSLLLIFGDTAQEAAVRLSRDVVRRVPSAEVRPLVENDSQLRSFYLGNVMLDRYARIGVRFTFDLESMTFRYDGAAWREIVERYPKSEEAEMARQRLAEGELER